jgi:hypothetical protein
MILQPLLISNRASFRVGCGRQFDSWSVVVHVSFLNASMIPKTTDIAAIRIIATHPSNPIRMLLVIVCIVVGLAMIL